MNLTIERSALLAAMQRVCAVVNKTASAPILQHVLIDAGQQGVVTFRGASMDMQATACASALIQEPAALTCPAHMLLDIAKNAAEGADISLKLDGPRLAIKTGRSRFQLPVLLATDFPAFDQDAWPVEFDMDASAFADMIGRTLFSASRDVSVVAFGGVLLDTFEGELHAFATHGKSFALIKYPLDECPEFGHKPVIPIRAVEVISAALDGEKSMVHIRVSDSKISVQIGDDVLICKLLGGAYPLDYRRAMAAYTGNPHTLSIGREALLAAIRRALVVGESKRGLRLEIGADGLTVSSSAQDAEGADELGAEVDGPELEIGFNPAVLIPALNAMKGERLDIKYADGERQKAKPVMMTSPDDSQAMFIVAPMVV